MIRSMTGFGSVTETVDGEHYGVEIRSLNGKHFKCHVRLPEELLGLEPALESVLSDRLSRGTITMTVRYQDRSELAASAINTEALKRYIDQLSGMVEGPVDPVGLLHLPGVLVGEHQDQKRTRSLEILQELAAKASSILVSMRADEGKKLEADLSIHLESIKVALAVVDERTPEVNRLYEERLKTRMQSLLGEIGAEIREEDVIREVAIFSEKSDISEEVTRLQGHVDQFRDLLQQEEDKPIGRTLDFLAQEVDAGR